MAPNSVSELPGSESQSSDSSHSARRAPSDRDGPARRNGETEGLKVG